MHLLQSAENIGTEPLESRGTPSPSPLERAMRLAFGERERLRGERNLLADENVRLSLEIKRLTEENAALREAARIWIRLYEKQLDRANRLIKRNRTPGSESR
jgi:hypothetical protein